LFAAKRRVHGLLPVLTILVFSYLALYVGWGCYMAVGENPGSYSARFVLGR
jgi:hypothetical protein